MRLFIRRSEQPRTDYVLIVALDVSAEEARIIRHHSLDRILVYATPLAEERERQAEHAFDQLRSRSLFKQRDRIGMLGDDSLGLVRKLHARMSYRIRIRDLLLGTTIHCRSLDELIAVERNITEALDRLAVAVAEVGAFSDRREQLYAPDNETPRLPAPAQWRRQRVE